jgi:hypothetical protein
MFKKAGTKGGSERWQRKEERSKKDESTRKGEGHSLKENY